MTRRFTSSSLAGTLRKLVAVGTWRLASMFWTILAATPRSGWPGASSSVAAGGWVGWGRAGDGWAAAGAGAGAGAGAAAAAGAAAGEAGAGAGAAGTGAPFWCAGGAATGAGAWGSVSRR
jgi:hypothetical protein